LRNIIKAFVSHSIFNMIKPQLPFERLFFLLNATIIWLKMLVSHHCSHFFYAMLSFSIKWKSRCFPHKEREM